MALYSFNTKILGRSSGDNIVAAAAYRSGQKIESERIGVKHDYSKKSDVYTSFILTPKQAPEWTNDRTRLWNEVDKCKKNQSEKSQLAREFRIALQSDLSAEQNIEVATEFAKQNLVRHGVICDLAFHDMNGNNPHVHILTTLNEISKNGFGNKTALRHLNADKQLKLWRSEWANITNEKFKELGINLSIDHRSYKDRDSLKISQRHEGKYATALKRKGIQTEVGSYNDSVREHNKIIESIEHQIQEIEREEKMIGVPEINLFDGIFSNGTTIYNIGQNQDKNGFEVIDSNGVVTQMSESDFKEFYESLLMNGFQPITNEQYQEIGKTENEQELLKIQSIQQRDIFNETESVREQSNSDDRKSAIQQEFYERLKDPNESLSRNELREWRNEKISEIDNENSSLDSQLSQSSYEEKRNAIYQEFSDRVNDSNETLSRNELREWRSDKIKELDKEYGKDLELDSIQHEQNGYERD